MTEPQALAFANPDGLALPGAFQLALACFADLPAIEESFRTGSGFAWGAPCRRCSPAASGSTDPGTSPTW